MLTIWRGDEGDFDSYKVNSVHCRPVNDSASRVNVTVNTPEGVLPFFIATDENSSVDLVAKRIASSIDKDITLQIFTERTYMYAIDNTLPEADPNHQLMITGGEGDYPR